MGTHVYSWGCLDLHSFVFSSILSFKPVQYNKQCKIIFHCSFLLAKRSDGMCSEFTLNPSEVRGLGSLCDYKSIRFSFNVIIFNHAPVGARHAVPVH